MTTCRWCGAPPDSPDQSCGECSPGPGYQCEWFALCDHEADRFRDHPIVGRVRICERCSDLLNGM